MSLPWASMVCISALWISLVKISLPKMDTQSRDGAECHSFGQSQCLVEYRGDPYFISFPCFARISTFVKRGLSKNPFKFQRNDGNEAWQPLTSNTPAPHPITIKHTRHMHLASVGCMTSSHRWGDMVPLRIHKKSRNQRSDVGHHVPFPPVGNT